VSWGNQLQKQGKFGDAEAQFDAAVSSGIADWQTRGNEALAGLYLAWGDSYLAQKKYDLAIEKYRGVAGFDTPGRLRQDTTAQLATAFAAYANSYVADKDWPNAVTWFKDLIKNYPDSPEAKLATASQLPDALYSGALAYVKQSRFQQARDAMTEVTTTYPHSAAAPKAAAAMAAPQPLTGLLETPDHQGVPNRLIRISTRWRIIRPGIYADYGTIYQTTTDRAGNFSLMVPPGKAYLVTWWDPGRGTFVTTFVSDTVPVNQVTIDPLQPEHATVTTA
jgi:tetratricopeptide (TPR) repeat protein